MWWLEGVDGRVNLATLVVRQPPDTARFTTLIGTSTAIGFRVGPCSPKMSSSPVLPSRICQSPGTRTDLRLPPSVTEKIVVFSSRD